MKVRIYPLYFTFSNGRKKRSSSYCSCNRGRVCCWWINSLCSATSASATHRNEYYFIIIFTAIALSSRFTIMIMIIIFIIAIRKSALKFWWYHDLQKVKVLFSILFKDEKFKEKHHNPLLLWRKIIDVTILIFLNLRLEPNIASEEYPKSILTPKFQGPLPVWSLLHVVGFSTKEINTQRMSIYLTISTRILSEFNKQTRPEN